MKGLSFIILGMAVGAGLAAWILLVKAPAVTIHREVIHSPAQNSEDGLVIEPQLTMPDEGLQTLTL